MTTSEVRPLTDPTTTVRSQGAATGPSTQAANPDRGGAGTYIALTIGLILMVIPFLWMAISSIKPEAELRRRPPTWLPETVTGENYQELFTRLDFTTFFTNSILVAAAVTIGNMVFC